MGLLCARLATVCRVLLASATFGCGDCTLLCALTGHWAQRTAQRTGLPKCVLRLCNDWANPIRALPCTDMGRMHVRIDRTTQAIDRKRESLPHPRSISMPREALRDPARPAGTNASPSRNGSARHNRFRYHRRRHAMGPTPFVAVGANIRCPTWYSAAQGRADEQVLHAATRFPSMLSRKRFTASPPKS